MRTSLGSRGVLRRFRGTSIARVGALVAVAGVLAAGAAAATTATPKTWEISVVTDLSGPLNIYGTSEVGGLETWVRYQNSKGGVAGRKLKLKIRDDRSDTQAGIAAFKEALNEKPLVLLGPFVSTLTAAAAPLAAQANVTTIMWSPVQQVMDTPHPALMGSTITLAMSARSQAAIIAELAKSARKTNVKIVIARADSAAGQDFSTSARAAIEKRGWTLVGEEKFANTATDVSNQAASMARSGADYCLCGTFGAPNLQLVKALRNNGSKMGVVTYYGGGFASTFHALNDPNYYATLVHLDPATPNHKGAERMRQRARKFGQRRYLVGYSFTQGYVMGMVLTQALEKCGPNCTPARLRKNLKSIRSYNTDGLTGPTTLSTSQFVFQSAQAFHVVNRKITAVGGWRSSK